jgi:chromosome segregation ATPase
MNDLIERLGKLQDSCTKQELYLLDSDYVWELAGRTADEIKRLTGDLLEAQNVIQAFKTENERLNAELELHKQMWLECEGERIKAQERVAELEAAAKKDALRIFKAENEIAELEAELQRVTIRFAEYVEEKS